jgi:hypothetical protein
MHFRRLHWAVVIVMLTALTVSAQTQPSATSWAEWETIRPEGEEFTVTMPKSPTTEATKFPYHKMELNARLYLASSKGGPVLAIVSLSGIKSNPAAYSDFTRFNSYIDAFKDFFPPKVRTKDTAITKLTLVSSRPFHGHTGRSYKMAIGELSGVVHAFATKKRFYAIVSLNTKKDDTLEEKFLSSFVLPERQVEQPKVASAETEQVLNPENQTAQRPESSDRKPGETSAQPGTEGNTEGAAPNAANNNQQPGQNQKRGPISGGMLNGKAIYLPQPEASGDVNGVVMVQVLIDEQGSVIEARPISGPQQLHAAAVNAARLARFSPTMLMGEPVKVSGTLSYNFARSN